MAESIDGHIDCGMVEIAKLGTSRSLFFDHHDPAVVKMFMGWR